MLEIIQLDISISCLYFYQYHYDMMIFSIIMSKWSDVFVNICMYYYPYVAKILLNNFLDNQNICWVFAEMLTGGVVS